jgi:hypothetical protein
MDDKMDAEPSDAGTNAEEALNAPLPATDIDAAVDDIINSLDAEAEVSDEASDVSELDSAINDTSELEGISL